MWYNIIKKPEIKKVNQTNKENNKSKYLHHIQLIFTLIMKYYNHKKIKEKYFILNIQT